MSDATNNNSGTDTGHHLRVSVVIAARNAAESLGDTIESLRQQTFSDWEAIIVDDGSSDETAELSAKYAREDPRIFAVSQGAAGVSAARNAGISLARFGWLLFLDADDWLSPNHLELMMNALAYDPGLDGVHCGWARVAPDGSLISEWHAPESIHLFEMFSRYCAFAIHACIVRRTLVVEVGMFDTSLRTCEDWDLWQRVTRTGARLGEIREVAAYYCTRPNSASSNARQMLDDGLRVIAQGHAPDPRVKNPNPSYASGAPAEELSSANFYLACWCASLALASDNDACSMLAPFCADETLDIDPQSVAQIIFDAAPLLACRPSGSWVELWHSLQSSIVEFLLELEHLTRSAGLKRASLNALQSLVLEASRAVRPFTVGTAYAIQIDVSEAILDVIPPAAAERLHCTVDYDGVRIGTLELPICDGFVPGYVLADAVAAEFAWPILYRFFERSVYRKLEIKRDATEVSVWRGDLCLAQWHSGEEESLTQLLHDRAGWAVFLQELWDCPDWPLDRFYNHRAEQQPTAVRRVIDGWSNIEVSERIPDVEATDQELNIVLLVGGVALGVVRFPARDGVIRAQEIRAMLTGKSGFELCIAAVREGLLGRPVRAHMSLRDCVAAAAEAAQRDPRLQGLALDWSGDLGCTTSRDGNYLLLARRLLDGFGTSTSRRAALPAAAARELANGALVAGEPTIHVAGSGEQPDRVVYMPDAVPRSLGRLPASSSRTNGHKTAQADDPASYYRIYFEKTFAKSRDPWTYTSAYDQAKYEQTVAMLPGSRIKKALELACAEGHFTAQLAPHVDSLIAADISQIALDRAAERCVGLGNVSFKQLDLIRDTLPGCFDLIVCSEVLYFADGPGELEAVARKLADALEAGGYLLTAHANLVVDEPDRAGFDWDHSFGAKFIGETFKGIESLRLVKDTRTPLYRIQLFRRKARTLFPFNLPPKTTEFAQQPAPPTPEVAAHVLWGGGSPRRNGAKEELVEEDLATRELPILMYHRVAPTGSPTTTRYRVTPDVFEQQLRYLRDAGYNSISLEDWHAAIRAHEPLPGRGVLITFDDGYLDFWTYAWPLLERYGFSATVFVVAGEIGGSNSWDRKYGEDLPLLGWKEILQLRDKGVEFGSHSTSHGSLTTLSQTDVVLEATRSRAILQKHLGVPVTAFAYPYGAEDRVIQHLIGACGYTYGLTCRHDLSGLWDPLLALPRIEVTGFDTFERFLLKLGD